MESFWGMLKNELVHHRQFVTREQAKQEIAEYIEIFCNRIRRQARLGYLSPAAFTQKFCSGKTPPKPLDSTLADRPYLSARRSLAISTAVRAQSLPFSCMRDSAWSSSSVVSTPLATGMPVSRATRVIPVPISFETSSKW